MSLCNCSCPNRLPLPARAGRGPAAATEVAPVACLRAWLTLAHTDQLGATGIARLQAQFGGACAALGQSPAALLPVIGASPLARLLAVDPARDRAVSEAIEWAHIPGHHVLVPTDACYPAAFAALSDPPPVLFVRGHPGVLARPALAIVGSRRASRDGLAQARTLAHCLARAELLIASGLAAGIDSAAHEGALAADGWTVGVVGTGVDRLYPAANHRLAQAILERGALVSELPLGSAPLAHHFPRRNRLIAALACATVVVQAARRSGSLITARLAADYGREVMALPGAVHSPLSKGCHQLIREGAALVEDPAEVAEIVHAALLRQGLAPAPALAQSAQSARAWGRADTPHRAGSQLTSRVLQALGWTPEHPDTLIAATATTSAQVSAALVELELDGWVERLPDGRFQRLAPEQAGLRYP